MTALTRRQFVRNAVRLGILYSAGTGGLYGSFLERKAVEITRTPITVGLGRPLLVACLGDIHYDPLCEADYLHTVVDMVNAAQPDLIALTGDYITHATPQVTELARILGRLRAPLGVFAALGNHDQWHAAEAVTSLLRARKIQVLRNASVALPDQESWFITALESYWSGRPDPACLDRTGPDSRHLLIWHEPDPFSQTDDPRVRLQMSGHTHGGQIRAPLIGALRLPSWGRLFDQGLFTRSGRHLFVNRGIGTVTYHLRVNCRPEISLLELT